jgi:hypothetical protein
MIEKLLRVVCYSVLALTVGTVAIMKGPPVFAAMSPALISLFEGSPQQQLDNIFNEYTEAMACTVAEGFSVCTAKMKDVTAKWDAFKKKHPGVSPSPDAIFKLCAAIRCLN